MIYTIGHSTRDVQDLIQVLRTHGVQRVIDIRSVPYSGYSPQYNRESITASLDGAGIQYLFDGERLGARSADPNMYIDDKVSYKKLAHSDLVQSGIRDLVDNSRSLSVAIMCTERDPLACHRSILVARVIEELGQKVIHIVDAKNSESHDEAIERLLHEEKLSLGDMFRTDAETIDLAYEKRETVIAFKTSAGDDIGDH